MPFWSNTAVSEDQSGLIPDNNVRPRAASRPIGEHHIRCMFSASKVALQPAVSSAPMGWACSTYARVSLKEAQKTFRYSVCCSLTRFKTNAAVDKAGANAIYRRV
jgi:hypothetical protein